MESFCPVNNLNLLEKVLEQLLKAQIDKFVKDHSIIPDYHHSSRWGHFTITATQSIQQFLTTSKDKQLNSAVILTDLGSAFDTCEHALLESKLEHVWFRDKYLEFRSSNLVN